MLVPGEHLKTYLQKVKSKHSQSSAPRHVSYEHIDCHNRINHLHTISRNIKEFGSSASHWRYRT